MNKEEIKTLLKQGKTLNEIASSFGYNSKYFKYKLRQNQISIHAMYKELYQELLLGGYSYSDIAKILKKSEYTIHKVKKKLGIKEKTSRLVDLSTVLDNIPDSNRTYILI